MNSFLLNSSDIVVLLSSNYECLAQLGEHFLDVEGVMGSSPLALTNEKVS